MKNSGTLNIGSTIFQFPSMNVCRLGLTGRGRAWDNIRRGSTINGDRFPKQWALKVQASIGVRGHAAQGNVWILTS